MVRFEQGVDIVDVFRNKGSVEIGVQAIKYRKNKVPYFYKVNIGCINRAEIESNVGDLINQNKDKILEYCRKETDGLVYETINHINTKNMIKVGEGRGMATDFIDEVQGYIDFTS